MRGTLFDFPRARCSNSHHSCLGERSGWYGLRVKGIFDDYYDGVLQVRVDVDIPPAEVLPQQQLRLLSVARTSQVQ